MKALRAGINRPALNLGARAPALPSDREKDHAERRAIYKSAAWRRARREFLAAHPFCSTPKCIRPAAAVDHTLGHQDDGWRERFWDRSRWAGLCVHHHNEKCGRERGAWQSGGDARTPGGAVAKIPRL